MLWALGLSAWLLTSVAADGPYPLQGVLLPTIKGPQPNGYFGSSLAADEDYVVVGASRTSLRGAVFVYSRSTNALLHTIHNPDPQGTGFPQAVAVSSPYLVLDRGYGHLLVYNLSDANPTVPIATLSPPRVHVNGQTPYLSFGISGSRIAVGLFYSDGFATYEGTAYVYDLLSPTPTEPILTLNNPDPSPNDRFASSVAISGTRVVISSPLGDEDGTDTGSCYVYDLASATPATPQFRLQHSGQTYTGRVAISGDRVALSTGNGVNAYDLGSETPSTAVAYFPPPDIGGNPQLWNLVVSGSTVAIAWSDDDARYTYKGVVYVYDLQSSTPSTLIARFPNPHYTGLPSNNFARALAIAGTNVLAGAAYESPEGRASAGSVYIFDPAGSSNAPTATLLNPIVGAEEDRFGSAVAMSGDRAVVGVPQDDNGGFAESGAVYFYELKGEPPFEPTVIVKNPNPATNDRFGSGVAISERYLVVGSPVADINRTDAGAVYVYDLEDGTLTTPILRLDVSSGSYSPTGFGNRVAVSGTRIAVGTTSPFRVYIFDLQSADPATPVLHVDEPLNAPFQSMAAPIVALSGSWLAVGNPSNYATTAFPSYSAGAVHIYNLDSATPATPVTTILNPRYSGNGSGGASGYFGYSVALSGSRMVVGAYSYVPYLTQSPEPAPDRRADKVPPQPRPDAAFPPPATYPGSAYLYDLDDVGAGPVTLKNPTEGPSDSFGFSVAISETDVFVGAPAGFGKVFVYHPATASPAYPSAILSTQQSNRFGWSVAASATHLLVGEPFDSRLGSREGAASVFAVPPPRPQIAVQDQYGGSLTFGSGTVNFGTVAAGGSIERWFTITNTGNATLEEITVTIDELALDVFEVTGLPSATLAPGESSTFTLHFSSPTPTSRTVQLHITSNDPVQNPFDIAVVARSLSEQEIWRAYYFDDPDGVADGADGADPDGDGNDNLFEYTAGVDPTDPNSRFHLRIEAVPNEAAQRAITFSPLVAGRSYEAKWKPNLSDAEWIPLTDFTFSDNGAERTVIDLSAAETEKFYHIEIAKP